MPMEGWREREADRKMREHVAGTVSRDAGLRRVLALFCQSPPGTLLTWKLIQNPMAKRHEILKHSIGEEHVRLIDGWPPEAPAPERREKMGEKEERRE
jgi:hypothetical protein